MIKEFQENTRKQQNEIRKSVRDMNEKFNSEVEILKKNNTQIFEMKDNTSNESLSKSVSKE